MVVSLTALANREANRELDAPREKASTNKGVEFEPFGVFGLLLVFRIYQLRPVSSNELDI